MFENQGGVWQVVSNAGGGIAFLGAFSLVLHFFGQDLKGFDLLDKWGPGTGLAIRIGMIVVGGIIWLIAKKKL